MKRFVAEILKEACYKVYWFGKKPVILYKSHRFIAPIIWLAHKRKIIPKDTNLFRLDLHFDAKTPSDIENIAKVFAKLKTFKEVVEFTDSRLARMNDDWLLFLMHIGYLKDSIVLGASEGNVNPGEHIDQGGKTHFLKTISELKGAFGHQGVLVDQSDEEYKRLWKILDWKIQPGVGFAMGSYPILFDIDLDHFIFKYRSRPYPWTRSIYNTEFPNHTDPRVGGMSIKGFVQKLIKRSPFITIAMEPGCCGGVNASKNILNNFNKDFLHGSIMDREFGSILVGKN